MDKKMERLYGPLPIRKAPDNEVVISGNPDRRVCTDIYGIAIALGIELYLD